MSVELTRRVPCSTCDGLGKRLVIEPQKTYERQCKDCTDGTVRVAVSCASCLFFDDEGFCEQYGHFKQPDWGCKSWTAKEGTDGNG